MRSSRRLASAIVVVAMQVSGCRALEQQQPGTLAIRSARLATGEIPTLELALDCHLSGPMQDALDHGIPLTLGVEVGRGDWLGAPGMQDRHRIELRYFPLSRRYQLRDLDAPGDVRTYASPGSLMAGLSQLRVPLSRAFAVLPRGASLQVGVALDIALLPGALRLPALIEPAWTLEAKDYTWRPAAG